MFFVNSLKNVVHYKMDPLLKAYMVSEMILWSAWNLINPIFAIFITKLPGGNIERAAGAISAYLLVRVIVELACGKILSKAKDELKLLATILGMIIMTAAYVSLAYSKTIDEVYIYYCILAFGLGFASPAKNSLFSSHLDKDKESFEWGLMDATVFLSMAGAAIVGGYVAQNFGFRELFFICAILNTIGILPYLIFIKYIKK